MNYHNIIYLKKQNECGLKPGDRVMITGKAESFSQGWNNNWPSVMDKTIGKVGTVMELYNNNDPDGIPVDFTDDIIHGWCYFPYFILEKVNG